jgi:predicted transcriptional regulator
MRRSKLELHLDILRVLKHGKPMSPTHLMYKVNVCYRFLEQCLGSLIEQNLVERKVSDRRRAQYAITRKGLDLLRNYGELQKALPIGEENKNKQYLNSLVLKAE